VIPNVLSIAGSDPSGGAGIQADLKAFSAQQVYGMAVITALTAQNTQGVSAVHVPPAAFVKDQLEAIYADIRVDAVKIGMIADAAVATAVADVLEARSQANVVLDPVMVAKGGARLLQPAAIAVLRQRLIPLSRVVTPNLDEAAALLGDAARPATRSAMTAAAQRLLTLGAQAVLLKGGHLDGADQPIGFCQHLLDLLQTGAAGQAGAQGHLDLTHLGEIQLTIEQCVERAFVKMRHSSPVRPSDKPRLAVCGPGPVWCRRHPWRGRVSRQSHRN